MKASTLMECIYLSKDANVTAMIWGQHGIGKSSIVEEACKYKNFGYINLRLALAEAPEIKGLPDKDAKLKITKYLPPSELPRGGKNNAEATWDEIQQDPSAYDQGILFLDEINRAQDDVLQAVFELVLDRKVGEYRLPKGWGIVCAGNYNEGGNYQTNGFNDKAFLDRFSHLTFSAGESTLEDWISWMTAEFGEEATKIIEFTTQNLKHLDGPEQKNELGFEITPSRRSWAAVTRIQKAARQHNYTPEAARELICGLVGMETGNLFENYNCPIRPVDVLKSKDYIKKLKDLTRGQKVGLTYGVLSYAKGQTKHYDAVLDYAEALIGGAERDVIVAMLRSMVTEAGDNTDGLDSLRRAALSNPTLAKLLEKQGGAAQNDSFLTKLKARKELFEKTNAVSWMGG